MAAPALNGATAAPAEHALRLSELIGALSREFAAAAASHQATMEHWKQVYQDSPVLAEYTPRGMQIISAQVSLPVALSQVSVKQAKVPKLTRSMIADALEPKLSRGKRLDLAGPIQAELARRNALSFSNGRLANDLEDAVRKVAPEAAHGVNTQAVLDMQRNMLAHPDPDSEIAVVYRAKDLQQVSPEHTFRLNLELKLE